MTTADDLSFPIPAVFLRVLEYFEGIMFLTTNRIESFDRAFKSRIHLTLHYPPLNPESCGKVLRNFLTQVDAGVSPDLLDSDRVTTLIQRKLNGRQIRNAVHIANSLAVSEGVQIGVRHLELALSAMTDFEDAGEGTNAGGTGLRLDIETTRGGDEQDDASSSPEGAPSRKRQRKDME
jgi:hypothetical protein